MMPFMLSPVFVQSQGKTALMHACICGYRSNEGKEILTALIEKGLSVDIQDIEVRTKRLIVYTVYQTFEGCMPNLPPSMSLIR